MLVAAIAISTFLRGSEIDAKKLQALVERARKTDSSALVVYADGKKVVVETFGWAVKPIHCMSATKSIVSLAVGILIAEGKLESVDVPVSRFYPGYTGGGKEAITIRHLLTHSSGIRANETTEDIYSSSDFVKNALDAPLAAPPGTAYFYNNRAVNLLAGVVGKAAGEPLDLFLDKRLFKPLGIVDYHWAKDPVGNPQGMSGLAILPNDLAKIGLMLAAGGVWEGKTVVPQAWIDESTRVTPLSEQWGQPTGFLWWGVPTSWKLSITYYTLQRWKQEAPESIVERLRPLENRVYDNQATAISAVRKLLGPGRDFRTMLPLLKSLGNPPSAYSPKVDRGDAGPYPGFYAQGFLGNYLVVLPKVNIVAVRMNAADPKKKGPLDPFDDFVESVLALKDGL
ncbi:serine hydrolase domain-containing protein [Fimbriimonas ginsengisoli]|uniref:Beta-lactamase n=1 Tax=Fimbriimonas ginsengisoli Gsoil 348 TaxID=661478 RepID=A0A068NN99_FIMGI|nr:serine hydrolase [Fimbriimonas ginsengisoli]AIE84877.1 beta-lactamase [Fimbriimonas ginsengisoli Gsoil 348]